MSLEPFLPRVAAGDRRAVRECIDAYGGLLWSLALRMLPSRSDAEDAVQEIFIELWKVAGRFDPALASERTFVAMIGRRRLIDRVRANKRRPTESALEANAELADDKHRDIERRAEVAIAAKALESLPPKQSRALALALGRGLTHSEVAEEMGIPLGTAKTYLRGALAKIREHLKAPIARSRSAS